MRLSFCLVLGILVLSCSSDAMAKGGLKTLDQAVDICTERAIEFGYSPIGAHGEFPPPNMVQDQYRNCVWALSHQYPTKKVVYRTRSIIDWFRKSS